MNDVRKKLWPKVTESNEHVQVISNLANDITQLMNTWKLCE